MAEDPIKKQKKLIESIGSSGYFDNPNFSLEPKKSKQEHHMNPLNW